MSVLTKTTAIRTTIKTRKPLDFVRKTYKYWYGLIPVMLMKYYFNKKCVCKRLSRKSIKLKGKVKNKGKGFWGPIIPKDFEVQQWQLQCNPKSNHSIRIYECSSSFTTITLFSKHIRRSHKTKLTKVRKHDNRDINILTYY